MELPDFMNYASKFSQKDFADKITRIAKRAGAKLVYAALILYYTLQSDKVSKTDKAIIIGALGYMISPLDVVPSQAFLTIWLCCFMCSKRCGQASTPKS